jgi:hypothetical protein
MRPNKALARFSKSNGLQVEEWVGTLERLNKFGIRVVILSLNERKWSL